MAHQTELGLRQPEGRDELPLLALLRAYRDVLEHRPPRVAWIPRGRRLATLVRTPSLGWLVRYLVALHVSRTAATLERRYTMHVAVGDGGEPERAGLERIRSFRQAVPRVLVGGIAIGSLFTIFSSFGLAGLKRLADAVRLNDRILELHHYVAASNSWGEETALALIVIALALALIGVPVVGSFRLKRSLFDAYPDLAGAPRRPSSAYVSQARGIYELERAAFGGVGARPPRELPLDLVMALLPLAGMVALLVAFGVVFVQAGQEGDWGGAGIGAVWEALLLLVVGARFTANRRAARSRSQPRRAAPALAAAPIGRRWKAQLADLPIVLAFCIPLCGGVALLPRLDDNARALISLLGVPAIAAALYVAANLTGAAAAYGASYAKSRRGLTVVRSDGAPAERWRLFVREGLLKWGLLGPASLAALFVPLVLNAVWPWVDANNRALHDVFAGTAVVEAEPSPAFAASTTTSA
jgi:uncharacterized RDD family membrane protein YckC